MSVPKQFSAGDVFVNKAQEGEYTFFEFIDRTAVKTRSGGYLTEVRLKHSFNEKLELRIPLESLNAHIKKICPKLRIGDEINDLSSNVKVRYQIGRLGGGRITLFGINCVDRDISKKQLYQDLYSGKMKWICRGDEEENVPKTNKTSKPALSDYLEESENISKQKSINSFIEKAKAGNFFIVDRMTHRVSMILGFDDFRLSFKIQTGDIAPYSMHFTELEAKLRNGIFHEFDEPKLPYRVHFRNGSPSMLFVEESGNVLISNSGVRIGKLKVYGDIQSRYISRIDFVSPIGVTGPSRWPISDRNDLTDSFSQLADLRRKMSMDMDGHILKMSENFPTVHDLKYDIRKSLLSKSDEKQKFKKISGEKEHVKIKREYILKNAIFEHPFKLADIEEKTQLNESIFVENTELYKYK